MKKAEEWFSSSQWTRSFGGSMAVLQLFLQGAPSSFQCESQNIGIRTVFFITERFFKNNLK